MTAWTPAEQERHRTDLDTPASSKRCVRCGQDKGPTAFCRDTSKADGLESSCRACRNAAQRERRRRQRQQRPGPHDRRCANRAAGRHDRACTAAWFGPDCGCRCSLLGYRGPFEFGDPTAPAPREWVA